MVEKTERKMKMKITGYRPVIVTKEADALVKLFEELGFERRHMKEGIEGGEHSAFIMKDENGNISFSFSSIL